SAAVQIGSVTENIGHTGAASGIAELIKNTLCLHHRFIPASAKTAAKPWILKEDQKQRQTIISSNGNMDILLKEPQNRSTPETEFISKNFPHLFILRGKNTADLQAELERLNDRIDKENLAQIAQEENVVLSGGDVIYNVSTVTLVLVAKTKKDLRRQIGYFQKQLPTAVQTGKTLQTPSGSYFTPNPLAKKGKIALVYPGSSTAYAGLGRDLFQLFPQLHDYFESKTERFDNFIWENYLYPNDVETAPNIYENAIAMMSTGVFFSSAHTEILQNYFKVKPAMAFGYSMGECSSMWYGQGVWNAQEAAHFQDSPLFKNHLTGQLKTLAQHWNISTEEAQQRWVSQILFADTTKVKAQVEKYKTVYLTFINTQNEVIISGDRTDCQRIIDDLKCQSMEVPFQNVIHHDFCKIERDGLLNMHQFELQQQPEIDFYSSISHQKIPFNSRAIAENSTQVCCETVDFPTQVKNMYEQGARIFIEVGAGATCTGWIQKILEKVSDTSSASFLAVAVDQKGKTDAQSIAKLLAKLISHGVEIDLSLLYPTESTRQQKRHLYQAIKLGGARVFDTLLNEDFKAKFANVKRRELAIAGNQVSDTLEVSDTYFGAEPVFAEAAANTLTISTTKKTRSSNDDFSSSFDFNGSNNKNMTSTIIVKEAGKLAGDGKSPANEGQKRIGENGLRLQDFESGEQLKGKEIIFSEEDLQEFAKGSIAKVFGEEYAIIDTYSRRTMLPMDPYLLVSRVTGLKGKQGEFKPSTMQTEYDIPYGAWYTTDGQIPWAVSVESGQCDLLLISYLGIDFQAKGNLVYRLLDCTLTFVDDLPFEGQTLRYDISINSFVRNGDNLLFFFSYRCYVEDRLVLKMDNGCAGYFKDDELADGNGVVYTADEIAKKKAAPKTKFVPLLQTQKRSFSKEDLRHLIDGNPHLCFADISYFPNGRNPSLCLPPEQILMLDRIVSVDLQGGDYGLGLVIAEKDLHPDDWYFPCHFRDDEVLAGSLQAEGGGNLLRFLM
ncbi:MAG: PfaB family protein, partial [Saprospiraceae bacterium]